MNINQQFEEWWKVYGEYLSPMAKNVARAAYQAGYEVAQQSVQRTGKWDCSCGEADHINPEFTACPVCGLPRR